MKELKSDNMLIESMIYAGGGSSESQRWYEPKVSGSINEDTITLNQLYKGQKPDSTERIYDYGTMIWDNPYEIQSIGPRKLDLFLCNQYGVEFVEDLFDKMDPEQHEIVDRYIADPDLSNEIIVMDNGYIVDGNHRAVAAAISKRSIRYIDIADEEELSETTDYSRGEELEETNIPSVLYHATYRALLRSIKKTGLGGKGSESKRWEDSIHGVVYLATDPNVAESYAEASETVPDEWLDDIVILKIATAGLNPSLLKMDQNVQDNEGDTLEYHGVIPLSNISMYESISEASPDTLEGSFTPDLVASKTWLCELLAKGLKGKNAGTIYILGSWYGNMVVFLQQAGIKFNKIVLVEPDEEALLRSRELLKTVNDDGKLVLLSVKAEDVVYEKPGIIINTSCNETGPVFLTKLPDGMLVALQSRNNVDDVLIDTESLDEFSEYFPLSKIYYQGMKHLEDPETEYDRYMIIGRRGKKLDEYANKEFHTGGALGIPYPDTYEQENDKLQSHGQRRIRVNF
jgi:hypothetical protein